LSENSYEE
jgi:hypothetical protein